LDTVGTDRVEATMYVSATQELLTMNFTICVVQWTAYNYRRSFYPLHYVTSN